MDCCDQDVHVTVLLARQAAAVPPVRAEAQPPAARPRHGRGLGLRQEAAARQHAGGEVHPGPVQETRRHAGAGAPITVLKSLCMYGMC